MPRIETSVERQIDRRTFLLASVAVATGAGAETPRLETFTEWLNASRKARTLALQPCVERIRTLDSSIEAWVQVLPQKPTGNGKLFEIPFGAKDIIDKRAKKTVCRRQCPRFLRHRSSLWDSGKTAIRSSVRDSAAQCS